MCYTLMSDNSFSRLFTWNAPRYYLILLIISEHFLHECDCPTHSCVDQVVKICRIMAAGSDDIETKKPAEISSLRLLLL